MNVYNLGTNSEKIISQPKKLAFNVIILNYIVLVCPPHSIFYSILLYDQVSVNVYNLGTNSEKNISQQKDLGFNGFIVLVDVKPIVIINFGKIFTIVLVDLL